VKAVAIYLTTGKSVSHSPPREDGESSTCRDATDSVGGECSRGSTISKRRSRRRSQRAQVIVGTVRERMPRRRVST